MKKKIALLLAGVMALSMTACGSSSGSTTTSSSGTTGTASTDTSVSTDVQDYEDSADYPVAENAAVYEGTDEWPDVTWNFDCSTGESSTWAQAGYYFNALMQESTGGKVKIAVYPGEQLTNGDQVAGIQALIDGSSIQVSLHSNLIYANFDPRFNVVSLPYLFADYDNIDSVMDGDGGQALKDVLSEYGLVCEGIGENGFRQITNSKKPITTVSDLSDLKMRICSNDLCSEVYREWGCNATVMNWSETYTALQQGTVDGQENPETAIDSASVQDVQSYISLWNAYYDCLFFCINQNAYDQFTDEQKAVIDANAQKAVEYQKAINRKDVEELVEEWKNGDQMEVTEYADIDTDSFKNASADSYAWYEDQLVSQEKFSDEAAAEEFVAKFQQ